MTAQPTALAPLEMWGGIECTVNRVGDCWFDQVARSGHDTRLDDLDRLASLGITAIRYPVLWERVAPASLDACDWAWTDHRLARLRALGIRPIVGLVHHGSGPRYTSLLDDRFPEQLAVYAAAVAARYPWVTDFTPVNEPLTTARFSALYGHWFPHRRDNRSFMRALLNQLRGTVLAMQAIRRVTPTARLIQTEDCGQAFGSTATAAQVEYEGHRRWLTFDVLAGRVNAQHPLYCHLRASGVTDEELAFFLEHACTPDVIGLNYYLTSDRWLDERLDRYPPVSHGGNGRLRYADVEAVRARQDGIAGHESHLLDAWRRYAMPVALTEVHLACTRDEQMRWLHDAWRAARSARSRGANVVAIAPWAMLGSFDWDSLVTRDAGHYEPGAFDLRSPTPRPTALAGMVRTMAAGIEPSHPILAAPGWWHRPERLTYDGVDAPQQRRLPGAPLLIIGASGTLGRALHRIATERGLPARLLGRPEVDITDPTRIDAVIRRVEPWAVINAAGYVRVDAAESDAAACRRANVFGAVNLAAACRRHELPFVTFSSDLVFDGAAGRPYQEDDAPAPLNVYGATKLDMERRVLDLLPSALVVRSSAFFGPWDDANFLAWALRAIANGQPFLAPADTLVSPTYVPDLVHATLDLLIDEEEGIWHLANAGVVSWYDFARMAAEACGHASGGIEPVATTRVWSPAVRPSFSALGSRRGQLLRPLGDAVAAFAGTRTSNASCSQEAI